LIIGLLPLLPARFARVGGNNPMINKVSQPMA
jgi:hypothetical protein